jgi:hypothetical protein
MHVIVEKFNVSLFLKSAYFIPTGAECSERIDILLDVNRKTRLNTNQDKK